MQKLLKELSSYLQSQFSVKNIEKSGSTLPKQLFSRFNDIVDNMDNGKVTALALLDLSAAFDTIDHLILLQRLQRYFGISGPVLQWFKSYFSDIKVLTYLAHYPAHNTFHLECRKDPSLALFC